MENKELWVGKDTDTKCELYRTETSIDTVWNLAMTHGRFRGHPEIYLTRESLEELFEALRAELYPRDRECMPVICGTKCYILLTENFHTCVLTGEHPLSDHECECGATWTKEKK